MLERTRSRHPFTMPIPGHQPPSPATMGFRGLGVRVYGLGLGFRGLGFRGLGFREPKHKL